MGNVRFTKDTVIKTGRPDSLRIEVEKTVRAFKIGQDCGLFQVPKVLDYDESKGEVVFERFHDIQGVRDVIAFGHRCNSLVETIGASLAIIHNNLILPKDMVVPLPPKFALSGSEVFLHGDLSVDNVCVGRGLRPIVILDWRMTKLHGGRSTYGTRYYDLMWFLTNLFYLRSRGLKYLFSNPVAPVARKFFASYFETSDFPYDQEKFVSYMNRFYRIRLTLKKTFSWKRRLLLPPCHVLWRAFIESFHL